METTSSIQSLSIAGERTLASLKSLFTIAVEHIETRYREEVKSTINSLFWAGVLWMGLLLMASSLSFYGWHLLQRANVNERLAFGIIFVFWALLSTFAVLSLRAKFKIKSASVTSPERSAEIVQQELHQVGSEIISTVKEVGTVVRDEFDPRQVYQRNPKRVSLIVFSVGAAIGWSLGSYSHTRLATPKNIN